MSERTTSSNASASLKMMMVILCSAINAKHDSMFDVTTSMSMTKFST